jgi:hypothetical protein
MTPPRPLWWLRLGSLLAFLAPFMPGATAAQALAQEAGKPAPPEWFKEWKKDHKDLEPSKAQVEVVFGPKARALGSGFTTLAVKITNGAKAEIKITLPQRMGRGQGLFFGQKLIGSKVPAWCAPVPYGSRHGSPADPVTITIASGASKEFTAHSYWPLARTKGNTWTIKIGQKYKALPLLVFELEGKKQYVWGRESTVEIACGKPTTLKTETYSVTYTPMPEAQVAGSLSRREDGFHLGASEVSADFHLIPSKPGEPLKDVAERDVKKVTGREVEGEYYIVRYDDVTRDNLKMLAIYFRRGSLVFKLDWFETGWDEFDDKKILKLFDYLKIQPTAKQPPVGYRLPDDPRKRYGELLALRDRKNVPQCVDAVRSLLSRLVADPKARESSERIVAIKVLARYRDRKSIPVLLKALDDPFNRHSMLGNEEGHVTHHWSSVAGEAAEALFIMTDGKIGERFRSDLGIGPPDAFSRKAARWRKWWEEHGKEFMEKQSG